MIQVITFTGTFTNTGKYGDTAVFLCDVIDQFLDGYGFTYAGTAEQADFTALSVRGQQVDNLDSCFQNFCLRRQFIKCRSKTVNRVALCNYLSAVINRIAQHVKYAAKCSCANRNRNWSALVNNLEPAYQSVCRRHSDTTDQIVTQVIGNLKCQINSAAVFQAGFNLDSVENLGQLAAFKFNIDNRTHNAYNASFVHLIISLLESCCIEKKRTAFTCGLGPRFLIFKTARSLRQQSR
ncbi:hypothetical protein D3C75_560850 [compost metagenome]